MMTSHLRKYLPRASFDQRAPILRSFRFLNRASVTPPGGREKAIELLQQFCSTADELIIADPYLLSAGHTKRPDYQTVCTEYLNALAKAIDVPPSKPKVIRTLSHRKLDQKPVKQDFAALLATHHKLVTWEHHDTRGTIHDRVWVKRTGTESNGLIVGSSLNGIGFKFSFIVELPGPDLAEFLAFTEKEFSLSLGPPRTTK